MKTTEVIWIYGIYGAGKSTLAKSLKKYGLFNKPVILDADDIRLGLNKDLSFAHADIAENLRRIAEVAKIFNEAGHDVIVAAITPKFVNRLEIRSILGTAVTFIWLPTPLDETIKRDSKGLYSRGVLPTDHFIREFEEPIEAWETTDYVDWYGVKNLQDPVTFKFRKDNEESI